MKTNFERIVSTKKPKDITERLKGRKLNKRDRAAERAEKRQQADALAAPCVAESRKLTKMPRGE